MLFPITRSSYICAQCRCRVLRNVAPGLLRPSLITHSRRNNSTFLAGKPPDPKPERGDISDDYMDSLVDSFIESAFSDTSLPPRPGFGIGKVNNKRRIPQELPGTWEEAGVRPVVAKALLDAYPNTIRPTDIQKRILQGLKAGNSVAVRDLPGTGKSFAIAAWVLGLERALRQEPNQQSSPRFSPTTTAFIFVPNADLGIQYYLMIKNLLQASSSQAISSSLDSFVQLLHRRVSDTELQTRMDLLSEKPNPHVIITTPAAALDIISHDSDSINGLLDFSQATAFVLDEFDTLIPRVHPNTPKRQLTLSPGIRGGGPVLAPPPTPCSNAEILLDWVFRRRRTEAREREVDPVQPQLVLSSATLSTSRMTKFIQSEHPLWIGHEEKGSPTMGPSLYDLPKASHLLAIGDESSEINKIIRAVADNIVHHAVAYDISSGFMRDAPIPRTGHWATEDITQKLEELKIYEAENAESSYQAKALKKGRDSLALVPLESWDMSNSRAKKAGYPPGIAAEALRSLLEHDKWPRNAIAAIGQEAGVRAFIEECTKLRINARELTVDDWNRDMEKEGRIPIGRTDMLFDPKIREYYKERNEREACRSETIVWVATLASVRGLDVPGVFHLYVLHRLQKAREYTTYCGRVARWPFPTLKKDIRDPRSLGFKVRRGVGKVVSLLLEDHVVPASGLEASSVGHQIITNDGSDRANWSWLEEGLMVAKIGCHFQDYFGEAGEYSCGPEVPKPTRPVAPPSTPSRTFNLLDAALGPDPSQKSSLSDPLEGSSPEEAPSGLFGSPREQPKQTSEEAQLEPSTNLPDLPDMWNLPFPDGSSKPRQELQQSIKNSSGDDDTNLLLAPKDPALPSQAPDFSLFTSPQEDFGGWRRRPAREGETSRLPVRANNAGNEYQEPLGKSRRGQGRRPGRSKALERVSTFGMIAAQESDFESPREIFRPDLPSDDVREKEATMLPLTVIDAEGYQEPPGTLKVSLTGFAPVRTERPKISIKDWEKDFGATLVPFMEAGVEPPESEEEAGKAKRKARGKAKGKGKGKAGKVEKAEKAEKVTGKKDAAKTQKGAADADTKREAKKSKGASKKVSKRPSSLKEEAMNELNNALESKVMGQAGTKSNGAMDKDT